VSADAGIRVVVPGGAYDVLVAPGLLDETGDIVRRRSRAQRCAVITDDVVGPMYADRTVASLQAAGVGTLVITVPAGEASKDWAHAGNVLEALSEAGLGRDSIVVALGGGVVGDLAGFCAATYLRGVPVAQLPTTLLAQTDSAVGGKTGVDLPRGKNLAGAFWQPFVVLSDTAVLESLPAKEWASGSAEVGKSAVLGSSEALAGLESDAAAVLAREPRAVERAVRMAATFKARVVSGDERESADRECLNYGHTLAHALERELGYGTITHGAAVAEGIRFAAHLAERVLGTDPAWTRRQECLLESLGLAPLPRVSDPERLVSAMRSDKKVRAGHLRFVLLTAPGAWQVEPVEDGVLLSALQEWCRRRDEGGPT
jgi:3-dehydroquinate synthase